MTMKIKKICSAVLALMMFVGCAQPQEEENKNEMAEQYTELAEENSYVMIRKDDLKPLLEHGTSVLFLGFPECVWCQAYVPMLEDILEEQGGHAEYYNIFTDKSQDRPFYDEIADLINAKDDSILSYGNDGKLVIYMPLVLFLKDGELVGYDHETCTEDSSVIKPEEYWTQEKKDAFHIRMTEYVKEIKEAQDENNSQGCENGCKVGG